MNTPVYQRLCVESRHRVSSILLDLLGQPVRRKSSFALKNKPKQQNKHHFQVHVVFSFDENKT